MACNSVEDQEIKRELNCLNNSFGELAECFDGFSYHQFVPVIPLMCCSFQPYHTKPDIEEVLHGCILLALLEDQLGYGTSLVKCYLVC